MSIFYKTNDLPERIQSATAKISDFSTSFKFAFKTTFKPNATIPILWFILTENEVLLCNTHKTRGIYKEIKRQEINSIRPAQNTCHIEIIYSDINSDNFIFTVDPKTSFSEIIKNLRENGYEIA